MRGPDFDVARLNSVYGVVPAGAGFTTRLAVLGWIKARAAALFNYSPCPRFMDSLRF